MSAPEYFWFEAQTGIVHVREPQAPSNFHRYMLPASAMARVMAAVGAATVGSGGLEYQPEFLVWLRRQDAFTRQQAARR